MGLKEGGREERRGEGEEVEGDEEEFIACAEDEENGPIRIVLLQNPASALIDALVTLITTAHRERRVHVNVMACKIQTDQSLEEDGPARESRCQEDEQARCRAAISDHIQYSTKLCGLIKGTGGVSIERIEQAGERVEEGAGTWVERHIVKRRDGEDNAGVANLVRDESEDILLLVLAQRAAAPSR